MLVLWMLYAVGFTAIVAGAALALEQLAAIWNVPRRVVWIAALTVAVSAPAILALRPAPAPQWMKIQLDGKSTPSSPKIAPASGNVTTPDRIEFSVPARFSENWNAPASRVWMGASIILFALFARGLWIVNSRRSEWEPGEVDGYPVLVADDVGPAVVGALRPRIVIPAWTLSLDRAERALVLRHEAEHVAARDPLVLMIASLALVLVPWNAALWFIVRRLRLAVEIDCDARVVRDAESLRDYGMLLIAVGARHSAALPLAASLTERQPDLERRILAMTSLRPSRPLLASLPFAALIGLAAVAVAQTPRPRSLAPALATVAPRSSVELPKAPTAAVVAPPTAAPRVAAVEAQQPKEAPVTVRWENASLSDVIAVFERFGGRKIVVSPDVTGTVTANFDNVPWTKALGDIARSLDAEMIVQSDGAIQINARRRISPPAPSCCEVPIDTIAVWMAKYHPNVVTGGANAEMVVFVVDHDGHYVTSRVQERRLDAVIEDDKRAAVEKMAIVDKMKITLADKNQMADEQRAREELATVKAKMALDLDERKAKSVVISDEDKRAVDAKLMKATAEVNVAHMKQSSALEGLNVPAESIQSVNVLKLQAGQMAPGPIGIITVFLKP